MTDEAFSSLAVAEDRQYFAVPSPLMVRCTEDCYNVFFFSSDFLLRKPLHRNFLNDFSGKRKLFYKNVSQLRYTTIFNENRLGHQIQNTRKTV